MNKEAKKKRLIKLLEQAGIQKAQDYFADGKTEVVQISNEEYTADYLLENGVIVPPCKAGDTVYVLGDEYFWEAEVVGYSILTSKYSGIAYEALQYIYKGEKTIYTMYVRDWGIAMFPTKAEAEYAVKNRRSVSLVNGHIEE